MKCRILRRPCCDHEKAVEQLKCHRRHREEVERSDHLAMVLQEGQPRLSRIAATPNAPQIPGDSPLRDNEAQLQQLAVDLSGTPVLVLFRQASDQNANLLGDLRAAAAWPGTPAPIESKASAVSTDHGSGFDDDQNVRPAGASTCGVSSRRVGPKSSLLAAAVSVSTRRVVVGGRGLRGRIASTAKEDSDGDKKGDDDFEHECTLFSMPKVASPGRRCEIASC